MMAGLPKGFVIDTPQTTQNGNLPEGFVVDTPQQSSPGFLGKVKDVGEGLVSYASSIPGVVARSGIVDKPLEGLATKLFGEEKVKSYKEKGGRSFSEFVSGSQVGGNPESKLAKGVEKGLNIAEMAAGGLALAKSISKGITKRGIASVIKETEKVADKRAALQAGRIEEQRGGISKFFLGGKDTVKPSKRTLEAVDTITSEIKGASTKPVKLYNQVSDKIEEIATNMSDKLKTIKIGTMTSKNKLIKDTIRELSNETADISTNIAKKIVKLGNDIIKSKNADDIWKAAKKLDGFMPEGIKKGANLSYKDQLIYNAWRKARNAVNKHIDNVAEGVNDLQVKEGLKKLSNLYHAKGQISSKIGVLQKPTVGMLTKIGRAGKEVAKIAGYGYLGKKLGIFGGNGQ